MFEGGPYLVGVLRPQPREIKVARFQARGMTNLRIVHGRGDEGEMEVTRYDPTHWQFDDGGCVLFRATKYTKAIIDHGAAMDFEAFEDERRQAIPDTAEYADLRKMFEATKIIRARHTGIGGH